MCGRYTQKKSKEEVEERFGASYYKDAPEPNFNATPGTELPIITQKYPDKIVNAKWGYVGELFQDGAKYREHVTATLENILIRDTFSPSIHSKRCLVFADGYYEWKEIRKGVKIPYYIQINKGQLFAFGGIYEVIKKTGKLTFCLITLPPTPKLSQIHHRMPVILTKEQERIWLDPKLSGEEAQQLAIQFPEGPMEFYSVSNELNKSFKNDPKYIVPEKYSIPVDGNLFS